MTLQILTVLVLGVATLWSAVPVGLMLGLGAWTTGIAAAGGAALGTVLVLSLSQRLRRHPPTAVSLAARPSGLMQRAWVNWGVPGFGLLAPLVVGAPLGAAVGVLLGASVLRLGLWLMIGIVLCSAGLTGLGTLGSGLLLALAQAATGVPGHDAPTLTLFAAPQGGCQHLWNGQAVLT